MTSPISNLSTQLAFSILENKGVFAVLLGSGVSRAADIPTGWEITLDLIRRVGLAQGIQEQSDWADWYRKKVGQEQSYSALLEELASSPEERRSILHGYIEPTKEDGDENRKMPTGAHYALADLVAGGYIRLIVTTNFDRLMENALRERGIEPTVVASTDALSGAEPIAHSTCYILKLHGDYKDARILNTDSELTAYPKEYDTLLDRIFDEYGLVVCGWSAEWDHALRAAFLRAPNRRYSVFWASRGEVRDGAKELINQRRARLLPIADANSFFKELRELVETLSQSQRQNPLSTELLVNSTKRYLSKPEFRIQLDELFSKEAERLFAGLDSDEFSPHGTWDIEAFRLRIKKYESLTEPIARMAGVLGRWGDGSELPIVLDIARGICRHAENNRGGLAPFLNIRSYPAVLAFTAYGLGLARAERWETLHQFLSAEISLDYPDHPIWTVEGLFLWRWKGGSPDLWNEIIGGPTRYHTPFSDHLFKIFNEWSRSFVGLPPDFDLLFDRFELLASLTHLERRESADIQAELKAGTRGWSSMPVGRVSWNSSSAKRLFAELQAEPTKTAILKAGFAKGSADFLQLFFDYLQGSRTR
jgi:SIR2-like domain